MEPDMKMKNLAALAAALVVSLAAAPAFAAEAATPTAGGDAVMPGAETGQGKSAVTTTPMPVMIRKVSVLIESEPSNSDIEVNGVYVGTTPLQVSLKEGVHHLKVRREGYLSWERAVKAYNGLYVSATLVQQSTVKRDETTSATAQ